jgi:hypothetical protein
MIITDLGGAGLEDMDEMVREGVASFKLFMAYPNVLMVDDATIDLLWNTVVVAAISRLHMEYGDPHPFSNDRGQRAVRITEQQQPIWILFFQKTFASG